MRALAIIALALAACAGSKSPPPAPPAPAPAEEPVEPLAAEEPEEPAQPDEATDPRELAKIRYVAGRKSYDLGEFDAAAVDFEAAYALYPDKSFLFNIGQAHRQAGHAAQAIDAYKRFLASDGVPASIRADVEGYIKGLGGTP